MELSGASVHAHLMMVCPKIARVIIYAISGQDLMHHNMQLGYYVQYYYSNSIISQNKATSSFDVGRWQML